MKIRHQLHQVIRSNKNINQLERNVVFVFLKVLSAHFDQNRENHMFSSKIF